MPLYLDDTTLKDLSIFEANDGNSIFNRFNHTHTQGGERYLKQYFTMPFNDHSQIQAVQCIITTFTHHIANWPADIGNGTVFILEKFLKYRFAYFQPDFHFLDRVIYILTARDYSMLKLSTKVCGDFFGALKKYIPLFMIWSCPFNTRRYRRRSALFWK